MYTLLNIIKWIGFLSVSFVTSTEVETILYAHAANRLSESYNMCQFKCHTNNSFVHISYLPLGTGSFFCHNESLVGNTNIYITRLDLNTFVFKLACFESKSMTAQISNDTTFESCILTGNSAFTLATSLTIVDHVNSYLYNHFIEQHSCSIEISNNTIINLNINNTSVATVFIFSGNKQSIYITNQYYALFSANNYLHFYQTNLIIQPNVELTVHSLFVNGTLAKRCYVTSLNHTTHLTLTVPLEQSDMHLYYNLDNYYPEVFSDWIGPRVVSKLFNGSGCLSLFNSAQTSNWCFTTKVIGTSSQFAYCKVDCSTENIVYTLKDIRNETTFSLNCTNFSRSSIYNILLAKDTQHEKHYYIFSTHFIPNLYNLFLNDTYVSSCYIVNYELANNIPVTLKLDTETVIQTGIIQNDICQFKKYTNVHTYNLYDDYMNLLMSSNWTHYTHTVAHFYAIETDANTVTLFTDINELEMAQYYIGSIISTGERLRKCHLHPLSTVVTIDKHFYTDGLINIKLPLYINTKKGHEFDIEWNIYNGVLSNNKLEYNLNVNDIQNKSFSLVIKNFHSQVTYNFNFTYTNPFFIFIKALNLLMYYFIIPCLLSVLIYKLI